MLKKLRHFTLFDLMNYTIFTVIMLICIYPFYYIFLITVSDPTEVARGHVIIIPRGFQMMNYISILQLPELAHAALISLLRTVIGTILTVVCSSIFGFLLSKKVMFLQKIVYRFVVVTMYFSAGLIPWYLTMLMLGLRNNFLLYVLPWAVAPFYMILIKTFIEQLPPSLEESAVIDGAGIITVFFRIIWPVSVPIIATIAVFSAVGQWNTFTDNMFLAPDPSLKTLQYLLYQFMQNVNQVAQMIQRGGLASLARTGYNVSPIAVRMTIAMVVVFPILLIYPSLQKYFVSGLMLGAIKG